MKKNARLFDLSLNNMDLHEYMGGYVPPHWHGELELFVLLEGLVTVRIGDQSYELKAGEGCFNQHRDHSCCCSENRRSLPVPLLCVQH